MTDQIPTTAAPWPDGITSNYGIMGGEPCIKGTRIPTAHIFSLFVTHDCSMAEISQEYDLAQQEIEAAIRFEGKRRGH